MQKKKQNYGTAEYLMDRAWCGCLRLRVFFKKNLRTICMFGLIELPMLVMFFGDGAASDGTSFYFGFMNYVFLGVEFLLVLGLATASKVSTPQDVPVPQERFTRHDGEQTWIDESRIQELVLYMDDLEDWFYSNYYTDE